MSLKLPVFARQEHSPSSSASAGSGSIPCEQSPAVRLLPAWGVLHNAWPLPSCSPRALGVLRSGTPAKGEGSILWAREQGAWGLSWLTAFPARSPAALVWGGPCTPLPPAPGAWTLPKPQVAKLPTHPSADLAETNLLRTVCSADEEARPFTLALVGGVPGKQAFQGRLGRAVLYPGNRTQSHVLLRPRLQPSAGQSGERWDGPRLGWTPAVPPWAAPPGPTLACFPAALWAPGLSPAITAPVTGAEGWHYSPSSRPWAQGSTATHTPLSLLIPWTIRLKQQQWR